MSARAFRISTATRSWSRRCRATCATGTTSTRRCRACYPLREALARKIELLYGRRYDPATEITVTSGATEGIFSTLTAFVRPGDEVVLFQPAYDSYVPAVQLSGGMPVVRHAARHRTTASTGTRSAAR